MNILVICPHFAPDAAPTGDVMSAIVDSLVERGHRVGIVTALPWYTHHRVEDGWTGRPVRTERTPWGFIRRLHPFPTDKSNIVARALGFAGFTSLATVGGMVLPDGFDPDVVLAMSPPLTLGLAGWVCARRHRVPLVFNIQDVFPDVAVEVGAITNAKVIALARALERFCYRRSDAVTVLSEDLRQNLAAKLAGHRPERVHVIPNFVLSDQIVDGERDNSYRREFGLGDRTVVMYAGNLGYSQSVELLIEAARSMADDPSVVFVINGGGSRRADLMDLAAGLDNVVFVGLQPKERLPEVLAAADIHCVLLGAGLGRSSVPSKLYSILAASRPAVASIDRGTEVERVLIAADAGIAVAPDDDEAFLAALRRLIDSPADRRRLGANGRAWVERWVSPSGVAAEYERLFETTVAARTDARPDT